MRGRRGGRPAEPTQGLSIWRPVHLGTDEAGRAVRISMAERMVLIGGEPGGGKSGALNLIVGHAALSLDCRLVLVDGKQVELGAWRDCADEFVGPDIDHANKVLAGLRQEMDERYDALLDAGRRKVSPESGVPPIVVVFDELAYFSATVGDRKQQNEFTTAVRDLVARGRAAGVVVVAATQRPSADIIPTSLRDLFGYRWAFRCTTPASSDVVLGHGWAGQGYSATDIDPSTRGVGWLLAEGGIPRRMRAAYLTDEQVRELAAAAEQRRATAREAG
jgi:S-DNA-T family DNA segregation ATPase FtsK/SpoIIIE